MTFRGFILTGFILINMLGFQLVKAFVIPHPEFHPSRQEAANNPDIELAQLQLQNMALDQALAEHSRREHKLLALEDKISRLGSSAHRF